VPVQLAEAVGREVARCLLGRPGPRLNHPFRRRPVPLIGTHGELVDQTRLC
jgi:DNA (cytosine-5)-methyltransferase 1